MLGQSYPPMVSGASLFFCHLAEAMAARGHEVLVLAASDQGKCYRQHQGDLNIIRLRSYPNPERVGQRWLFWPARAIQASLHQFRPEIIHLHDPFQMAYFSLKYSRKFNIPCVINIHGLPSMVSAHLPDLPGAHDFLEKGLWSYATWLIRLFDAAITPTETISNLVARRTGVRTQVISYGLDVNTFHPGPLHIRLNADLRNEFGIPDQAPIILHTGRLDADKNVKAVIQAAAKTIHHLSEKNIHLLIVGDGTEKPDLIHLAKELNIPTDVQGAIQAALSGAVRRISLGKIELSGNSLVTPRYFCLMAGIGFDAKAVYDVNSAIKRISGEGAYVLSGIKTLISYAPAELFFTVDNREYSGYAAIIGKASRYGGHFMVTPDANIFEPSFSICIFTGRSRADLLRYAAGVIRGTHLKLHDVIYLKASNIAVIGNAHIQIDGEYLGTTPARISVEKDALQIVY